MLYCDVDTVTVSLGGTSDATRRMLLERRRELSSDIVSRVREVREVGAAIHHRRPNLRDAFDAEPEDDLMFALIQMKTEMLEGINEAIRRLDEGTYGHCAGCGEGIALTRLRAMPFAVRCRECEERREFGQQREHPRSHQGLSSASSRL